MENQSHIIIKALRKYYGETQVEFSNFLQVSQGALSKIEAGKLEVSAQQWISICNRYKIDPCALVTGIINTKEIKADESAQRKYFRSFKVPKKYSYYAESTVRTAYPFIRFMESKIGKEKTKAFLNSLGFQEEYFVILDNPVNLMLINDLSRYLIQENLLSSDNLHELFKLSPAYDIHSYVVEDVKFSSNIQTALVKFISQIGTYYERNTCYEFIGDKDCYIQARDAEHVREFDLDPEFKAFRKIYNAKYFQYLCNNFRAEKLDFQARRVSGGWDVLCA